MVSTEATYMRGVSPPKYRRQTLQVFDVYADHKSEYTQIPPRPASALDRKWVHRSLGDLTADTDFMNSHPRLQTNFYQDLIRRYPQAFTRRREARENGRKLFNSRPHVRFEDEEKFVPQQKSRSVLNLHRGDNELTNWDREVGPYIRKNTRECFTSVDPSECSGSVLSLKQRLHINSITLNKLLNEKSPLRKKFERDRVDDSGTENEQSLEDYFLDKSRQRSRNRVKHRRVLQRRINHNNNNNSTSNNELAKHTTHRRWMSKSVSPTRGNLYSLPTQHADNMIDRTSKNVNVESVMRDSDLKIDTLLEKINSKMSGPESPPDSAIDVDTPSVQSFMSSEKVMTSDNVYHVTIDLDDKAGDFESESSPESSPSMNPNKRSTGALDDTSAIVKNSAMNTNHSISHESQISVSIDNQSKVRDIPNVNYGSYNNLGESSHQGPGLLQLYSNQIRSNLDNNLQHEHRNTHTADYRKRDHDNQDDFKEWEPVDGSFSTLPPRGRHKKREGHASKLQKEHRDLPNRSDLDSSILDEIQLDKLSHDLHGRRPHTDNTDDTDIRLGIPKVTSREAKIAEKYRRARSPSPFILTNRRLSLERPKSAPSLMAGRGEMRLVDIPFTGESENDDTNTPLELVTRSVPETCQRNYDANNDINANDNASVKVRGNIGGVKKKSCVQNSDSKILVSSSQIKQRNDSTLTTDSRKNSYSSSTENGNSVVERDLGAEGCFENEQSNENSDEDHPNIPILEPGSDNEFPDYIPHENQLQFRNDNTGHIANRNPQPKVNPRTNMYPESSENLQTKYSSNENPQTKYSSNENPQTKYSSNENPQTKYSSNKKGFYKPSATSPRTTEKRFKLKSLLKTKRGSFSPAPSHEDLHHDQATHTGGERGQIYPPAYNDRLVPQPDITHNTHSDRSSSVTESPAQSLQSVHHRLSHDETNNGEHIEDFETNNGEQIEDSFETESPTHASHDTNNGEQLEDSVSDSDVQTVRSKSGLETGDNHENIPQDQKSIDMSTHENRSVKSGKINTTNQNNTHFKTKGNNSNNQQNIPLDDKGNNSTKGDNSTNLQNIPLDDKGNNSSSQESLPRTGNVPPVKPVRQKHKKLPNALDLSAYRIMPNGEEVAVKEPGEQTDSKITANVQPSKPGQQKQDENQRNQSRPVQKTNDPTDHIETLGPQASNLEASKGMSASKGSLFGGFKSATKGKLKSLRKAMSLERGMDKAGVLTFPDPNNQGNTELDNDAGNTKMKKAPSLKSITSIFGRKKKKKGKLNAEETQSTSTQGSNHSSGSGKTGTSINSQPKKSQPKQGTSTSRPIGKLRTVNPDGTQIIQLVKPASGPIGFFIAKGSAKFKNGIFISRFADPHPERVFGGLLSIGDEILEVNGHFVRDLSQDDVYDIISASPIVVMKVFPFIARKDI